ncbi:MFS transporter [Chelatococcus reniformis]|uniref:Cyanate transporter n=1 Tax=Chelatococcus reniformis TaxID=1494448 RepID=A0A916X970_9HYPH|nr:MFS transporter [Chelatococcus reniformis]GGC56490.1 cyanate transporter [Chelatococcus reniformis]
MTGPSPPHAPPAGRTLLVLGILLVAAALRAPITAIAPVLPAIRADFALGTAQAGLLTTLPLLTFALLSPISTLLARGCGLERTLFAAIALVGGGIAVRSFGPAWCLFAGTMILGTGIAIANVLLPGLLKRDFPDRIATMTAAYAVTMGIAAAGMSALMIPLAHATGSGWRLPLATAILFPAAALAVWLPQLGGHTTTVDGSPPPRDGRVWRSALAWQVTAFMGLNSFLFYVLVGWFPSILADAGFSATDAGALHGLMQISGAAPGLLLGPIVARMRDQRLVACIVSLATVAALLGLLLLPGWAVLWSVCFGIGNGSTLILSLMFMSLRATSPHQAAALSGMAQSVGYGLAAVGPPLAGLLHDASGGWHVPLGLCVALSGVMVVAGVLAGRSRTIAARHDPRRPDGRPRAA